MPRTIGPSGRSIIKDSGLAFLEELDDIEFIDAPSLNLSGGGG